MAETLKIEIEVNGGAGEGGAAEEAGIKSKQAKDNINAFWTLDRAKAVAKQFTTQVVNGHIGMIGSRTGNYVLQERLEKSVSIANKAIGIGMSFAVNPYLGLLNIASEGIGFAFEYAARMREINWQNKAAGELARRAGYLSDANRNR